MKTLSLTILSLTFLSLTLSSLASARVGLALDSFTEPFLTIKVASPESGLVAKLEVQEGDRVAKDAVLATLDAEVLQAQWNVMKEKAAATAKLNSSTAEQKLRSSRLDKLQQLQSTGYASPEEIYRAQTDLAIAESNLQSAQEERTILRRELEFIEAQLERRHVRSPIDGVVTKIDKQVAEFVAANDPGLMTLVQLHPLRITAHVTVSQAARLSRDTPVTIRFRETGEEAIARVEFISPVTEPVTETVRVKLLLDNEQGQHRSGVPCQVKIE